MEEKLKDFVITLRKKHRKIQQKQFFCNEHKFDLEFKALEREAQSVNEIIMEMESFFDLGFVWDSSLD